MAEVYRVELKFDADSRDLQVFVKEMGKGADVVKEFDRSLDIAAEGVSELELRLSSLDKQLDRISKLEGIFRDIAISGVAMAYTGKKILDSYLGLGGELVEEAAQFEYLGSIFGVLFGDPEKGAEFNRQLDEAVRDLPIYHRELALGVQIAMTYGAAADGLIEKFEGVAWASKLARRPVQDIAIWIARLADPSSRGIAETYLLRMGLAVEKWGFFAELAKDEIISVDEAFAEFNKMILTDYAIGIEAYKETWVHQMAIVEANIVRIKQNIGAEFMELLKGPLKEFGGWLVKISTDKEFKEWIHRFTEGLRQMGTVMMWIFKIGKRVFDPILRFLERNPEIAGWIAGFTGLGAVLLIVAGGALALFGNFGMLLMSKRALVLEIERYNIEAQIANATMQQQSASAAGLATSLGGATAAQSAYNAQQQIGTKAMDSGGVAAAGFASKLGLIGLAITAAIIQVKLLGGVIDWLNKKMAMGLTGGTEAEYEEFKRKMNEKMWKDLQSFSVKVITGFPEEPAEPTLKKQYFEMGQKALEDLTYDELSKIQAGFLKASEEQREKFLEGIVGAGRARMLLEEVPEEMWGMKLPAKFFKPGEMPPVSPEDIYGGGGVGGGGGRGTEMGPQINTYYITQHFEDGSVQIIPEGEFDAEGFLTEMEALAPG